MKRRLPDLGMAFAPPQSGADPLVIEQMKAWRIKEPVSGRRYTVIRVQSRNGQFGFGEGGPAQSQEILEARAAIAGRRPHEFEFVRARLASLPSMEAAVSNAMLDLLCRAKQVPMYQFLGGPTKFKSRVLARLEGMDETSIASALARAKRQGFKAFTMPVLQRDSMIPLQEYVNRVRTRVAAIRGAGGVDSEWVLDGGAAMTPGDAASVAMALEKSRLMWLDEPTSILTTDALEKITSESVMPVGLGRDIVDIAAFQGLLRAGCVNVLRPAMGRNSIAKIRRMAALAETHYVAVSPFHDGGPIGSLTAVHLAASLPNVFTTDVPIPAAERDAAMRAEITSGNKEVAENGYAALMNRPGLGTDINERALDSFSEERI